MTTRRPKTRPYTEEDRRRLLAPIAIRTHGGKSWGGAFSPSRDVKLERKWASDRYGYGADWADLDGLR